MLLPQARVLAIVGGHDVGPRLTAAVAQLGHCSATLVAPRVLLTSAHCIGGPLGDASVGGTAVPVTACTRHPSYEAGKPAHDLGFCLLSADTPGALPVDDGPLPVAGAPVSLAGFGSAGPMSHEKAKLRAVSTSVTRVADDHLEVGTPEATACHGDSGGPLLIEGSEGFRVVGLIQGAKAAICGSETNVVPLGPEAEWLRQAIPASTPGRSVAGSVLGPAVTGLLGTGILLVALLRSRGRRRFGPAGQLEPRKGA